MRRAVVAMASTASGGVSLLAIAWLAARRLTPAELGFFFSFLSIAALVQLADFGLSYASLQTGGRLAGTGRLDEIPGVATRVHRWNLATSGVSAALAAAIGATIFSARRTAIESPGVAWHGPWAAYIVGVFLNQLTIPQMALREGSGRVTQMWRLRLTQEWIAGIACLAALHEGWGLWSLSVFAVSRAVVAAAWLRIRSPLRRRGAAPPYSLRQWMAEIWPFQWKIGVSWLAGFLIFRAFAPIILIEKGPVAAGQFGLAISLMNLLISVSSAWPLSQAAHFAALSASRRFGELRREFPFLLAASTLVSAMAAAIGSLLLWEARRRGVIFALRLPEPNVTTLVLATAVVHHVVFCFAVLLRSEGREPLLLPSVLGGLLTASLVWAAAHFGALRTVALTNLACAAIGIPIVLVLFRRWRRAGAAE